MVKITEKAVFAAARALQDEGKRVTGNNVREKLGGGSFTTITPILARWRDEEAEKQALATEIPDGLSDAVDDFARRLWLEATRIADKRVEAAEKSARECEASLKDITESLEAEIVRLEAENDTASKNLDHMQAELTDEKARVTAAQISAAESEAVRNEQAGQLKNALEKIDRLQQEAGQLRAELKMATSSKQ